MATEHITESRALCPWSVYGLLLIASPLRFGARADCTRIFGL